MDITRLIALNKRTQEIVSVALENQDWETAYDLIFPGISGQVRKAYSDFGWYDPDSGYDDDVLAFARALKEVAERAEAFTSAAAEPDVLSVEAIVQKIKDLFHELSERRHFSTNETLIIHDLLHRLKKGIQD
jgi:hypothetical protein